MSALADQITVPADTFRWTEERVAFLKQRFGENATMSQIADELGHGATRNAVIGKAHRLGLNRMDEAKGRRQVQRSRQETTSRAPKPVLGGQPVSIAEHVPSTATRPINGIGIIDLRGDTCRWPLGEPGGEDLMLYCGATVTLDTRSAGFCYCAGHLAIAYQKRIGHLSGRGAL